MWCLWNFSLISLLLCNNPIFGKKAADIPNPLENSGKLSDKFEDSDEQPFERSPESDNEGVWTVYEPEDFDRNELCSVLSCKKREMCLVRNNNAVCSKLEKLDEIDGDKIFYKSNPKKIMIDREGLIGSSSFERGMRPARHELPEDVSVLGSSSSSGKTNAVDEQEWDQQRVRDKMLKFISKMRQKHRNKMQESSANEVHPVENSEETRSEHDDHHMTPLSGHERHSQRMGAYQNCTDKELSSIKGRLSKWFSDIHSIQKSEQGYVLPRHDYFCTEDVGFMFSTLDGDKDGKLSVDELFSLDNDPYEKCIKIFLDRCDIDSDDFLSLNEWCDCFQWSDDERHEPACHAALRKHDPHDPDSFFPNCDLEGYYKMEQCQSGYCWCVDKWGREFDQSRTKGPANCSPSN